MKLIRKTHHHYTGKVHDLTVSNTHSYNVEGLAVHNSAAGSLVSYLTNITSVDPIRWGLMFSRFLRKDAKDMPDIDFDVAAPMELKEELAKEWGSNCVVPISNWNTLQLRSLLKDISKFYDIPFQEVNQVTSKMLAEATPQAKRDHGITAGVYNPTFEELMKYSQSLRKFLDKYPQVKTHVKVLNGQVRSCFTDEVGILTNKGYKFPLEIDKGDKVAYYSSSGEVEFNDDWEFLFQGKKEVYRVETEDGTVLELTADHEVMTQSGYKKVEDLTEDDYLVGA
jgi:DNA polymerase-3 subunit alpha